MRLNALNSDENINKISIHAPLTGCDFEVVVDDNIKDNI